jgi:hypothetical protein
MESVKDSENISANKDGTFNVERVIVSKMTRDDMLSVRNRMEQRRAQIKLEIDDKTIKQRSDELVKLKKQVENSETFIEAMTSHPRKTDEMNDVARQVDNRLQNEKRNMNTVASMINPDYKATLLREDGILAKKIADIDKICPPEKEAK